MGYDVPSDVEAGTGGLLLDKGSAKASIPSLPSFSGGVEKTTVVLDDDNDAAGRWILVVNATVLPDCKPIVRASDHAKRETTNRAMM